MGKYAVLLNASTNEIGQTANGLEYALDLDENDHEVDVYLDGAATQWPRELETNPDNMVNDYFTEAQQRDLVAGACSHCTTAFESTEEVEAADIELLGDGDHGPSVGRLADEGYELVTIG